MRPVARQARTARAVAVDPVRGEGDVGTLHEARSLGIHERARTDVDVRGGHHAGAVGGGERGCVANVLERWDPAKQRRINDAPRDPLLE